MAADGDDLDALLCVVQSRMVSVQSAMAAEVAREDEEERRWFRHYRLVKQLEMLDAARQAHRLAVTSPRPSLAADSVREIEERCGFVPGTYAGAVGQPSGVRAVMVEQGVELAVQVTRTQLAHEDGPVDGGFTAAVFRICCATVIGAFVGAPLGALAAHGSIVLKMAEAAVVVGLGASTAEIIEPVSVLLTDEPEAPPDVADDRLAMSTVRDVHNIAPPSDQPDDEPPPLQPINPPVRPPFDEPVRRPFGGPGPF